jgi:hypothetical protein
MINEEALKNLVVYHASRVAFKGKFDEKKIGTGNDPGYSGRGFYFFANKTDGKFAAPNGYIKPFEIDLDKVYHLTSRDDPFSEDTDMSEDEQRDTVTLQLLKQGYKGSIRYLNGKIEEICVFSYKSKGYDGNRNIRELPGRDWEKI